MKNHTFSRINSKIFPPPDGGEIKEFYFVKLRTSTGKLASPAGIHTVHNIPDVKTASEGSKFTLGMPLRCGSDCCQHGCPLYQHQMEAVQTPIWGEKHIIESPDSHDVHNPRDASVECHQQHKRGFNAQFMNSFTGCVLSTVPVIVVNGKRHSACEVWSAAHCQKIRGNNHWQTGAAPGHPLHEHRSFAGFWCFWGGNVALERSWMVI
jgi:hypothetical protein